MKTCKDHDDVVVVYDSWDCPLCELVSQLGEDLAEARERIDELEVDLEEAHTTIAAAREEACQ